MLIIINVFASFVFCEVHIDFSFADVARQCFLPIVLVLPAVECGPLFAHSVEETRTIFTYTWAVEVDLAGGEHIYFFDVVRDWKGAHRIAILQEVETLVVQTNS